MAVFPPTSRLTRKIPAVNLAIHQTSGEDLVNRVHIIISMEKLASFIWFMAKPWCALDLDDVLRGTNILPFLVDRITLKLSFFSYVMLLLLLRMYHLLLMAIT